MSSLPMFRLVVEPSRLDWPACYVLASLRSLDLGTPCDPPRARCRRPNLECHVTGIMTMYLPAEALASGFLLFAASARSARYTTMDHGSGTRRYWPAVSTRWAKPGKCKW